MTTEDPGSQTLPRFLYVPGLLGVAIFGILVVLVSRLFGPEDILRGASRGCSPASEARS